MSKPVMTALLRVQLSNDLAAELAALPGANPLGRVQATGRIVALLQRLEGLTITPEQAAFDKAKAFYQGTLQGQVVQSVVGPVRLTGKGWRKAKFGLKEDLLKARLIEHIVEILQGGTAGQRREPYKARDDGMVAFYFIQKDVQIDQELVTAGVTVGEDAQGNLFYNVSHAGAKGWTANENGTLDSTWIEPRFVLDAVNDSVAEDDLNITILAVRPVGGRQAFATVVPDKGGAVLILGDAEAIAMRVREQFGKPQIVEGGVRLTKGDARLAKFIPREIETLASGAVLEHYASGGVAVRGDFRGGLEGIAQDLPHLESAFVYSHGPEVFAQVFGKEADPADAQAYFEQQDEIAQRHADNEARETAERIEYARRTDDWSKLTAEERAQFQAERDAAMRAYAERDLANWMATIGAGTSENPRLQAYLDTVEDLSPENRTMIQVGYMGWIPKRIAEFEPTAGPMPYLPGSPAYIAWQAGFTAHCRAWADAHLSERVKSAGSAEQLPLYQATELYHGTALPFDTFVEGQRRGAGFDHQGAGWYLTNDRKGLARYFASMAAVKLSGRPGFTPEEEDLLEEGVILRVSIAGARVLDLTRADADPELVAMVSDIVNGNALRERVLALGFDGVAFVEPNPPEGVVVLPGVVTVVMYHPEKGKVLGYEAAESVPALPFPSEDPQPEAPTGRAKPGGEVGINGFFYKGGTFLPSTQLPPQGSQGRSAGVRTHLIEPGVRAEAPEGYGAIFGRYQEFIQVGADGVASVYERPDEAIAAYVNSDVAEGRAFLRAAVEAYNGGMRWYKAGDIEVTEKHREEPAAPEYEIIEHETGRKKILRGIVRTDLTYAEAKAIDEYTFKKNGGYFIREKHLEAMGLAPAGGGEPAPVPAVDPEAEALRQQQREIERQQREADRLANEQERERRRVAEQVATLRKVAASSLEKANEELNRDRLTNTARRAGMAASILERAEKERALSVTLGNLADAIEQGKATHLAGLTSKAQLATLHNALVGGRHRVQTGLSYAQQQELKYAPLSGKDVGYAQLPRLFMNHDYDAVQRALETGKPKGWQALSRQLKLQNRDNIDPVLYNAVWKALESVGKTDAFNWYGREQLAKRNRLTRMGLTTDDELRVALGEYLQYKEGVREEDPIAKAERAIIGQKVGIDFFPTPKGEASNMASLAQITKGMRVLEPSAGNGNLADAARAAGAEVDVIEISDSLRKILDAKGYNLVAHDFMEFAPEQPYDAILMNPPFSNRRDAEHIRHAFGMLKPGGHLVAIAGEGVFNGSDAKAVAFRDWLDQHGAEVEPLAKGTFEDKKLLATTGANARRIVLVR